MLSFSKTDFIFLSVVVKECQVYEVVGVYKIVKFI